MQLTDVIAVIFPNAHICERCVEEAYAVLQEHSHVGIPVSSVRQIDGLDNRIVGDMPDDDTGVESSGGQIRVLESRKAAVYHYMIGWET